MCRLFGLTTAPRRTHATFWLLDAPDSLDRQSHRNPDGTGLGFFTAGGHPEVVKQPIAAWADRQFAAQAHRAESTTFVAHVRHASTGALTRVNTHPFRQDGRLFAHNGVLEGLDQLEARLGGAMSTVAGDTDSERLFALISVEIQAAGGDVVQGITSATRWVASHLPVYSINLVLISADGLWALRYPDTNRLYWLERAAGGHHGGRHGDREGGHSGGQPLRHRDAAGATRVQSADLATRPAVVVASEPMDDHPDWRAIRSGDLLYAGPDGRVTTTTVLPEPPAHPLALADLHPDAAASQQAG